MKGGGSGCAIWFGGLLDLRVIQDGGQDVYVRWALSDMGTTFDFQFLF